MVLVAPEGQVPEASPCVHFRVAVQQAVRLPFFGALEPAMGQQIATRIGAYLEGQQGETLFYRWNSKTTATTHHSGGESDRDKQ